MASSSSICVDSIQGSPKFIIIYMVKIQTIYYVTQYYILILSTITIKEKPPILKLY